MLGDDFTKAIMRQVLEAAKQTLRDKLGAIRHPDTGEFPMIIFDGDTLEDLRIRVEGSTALLAIVKARLSEDEQAQMNLVATDSAQMPRVFLSYGAEDRDLAKTIAETLFENGVQVWWDIWEIGAGDSIRRKIDEGLSDCTHFVVLLTPTSITRPWVQEEIDAAFMRKVAAKSRLIPIRHKLQADALPPLLAGTLSPEIDDGRNLQALIADIKGITRKPVQEKVEDVQSPVRTGYSPAATAIAELFVKGSQDGMLHDPVIAKEEIANQTNLHIDDVTDAVYELRSFLEDHHVHIYPKSSLFSEFDQFWQDWNPADDALKLAADCVNNEDFPDALAEIAERYSWPARRINPAANYLCERNVVDSLETLGSAPFSPAYIMRTDATRRFLKSRT